MPFHLRTAIHICVRRSLGVRAKQLLNWLVPKMTDYLLYCSLQWAVMQQMSVLDAFSA